MKYFLLMSAVVMLGSCSSGRTPSSRTEVRDDAVPHQEVSPQETPAGQLTVNPQAFRDGTVIGSRPMALPKGIVYKTSGDFRENVPVRLNADGTLLGYPAPQDIPENVLPVSLEGGWLLSPVGVGSNTVFTRYTYSEYRQMKEPPSPEEILKSVIPGAKVTATMELPMTLSEALADTAAVNRFLSVPTPLDPR